MAAGPAAQAQQTQQLTEERWRALVADVCKHVKHLLRCAGLAGAAVVVLLRWWGAVVVGVDLMPQTTPLLTTACLSTPAT